MARHHHMANRSLKGDGEWIYFIGPFVKGSKEEGGWNECGAISGFICPRLCVNRAIGGIPRTGFFPTLRCLTWCAWSKIWSLVSCSPPCPSGSVYLVSRAISCALSIAPLLGAHSSGRFHVTFIQTLSSSVAQLPLASSHHI